MWFAEISNSVIHFKTNPICFYMNRVNSSKLLSTILPFILLGLVAVILHPYVHVFNHDHHDTTQHVEVPVQEEGASDVDISDSCYACTLSKSLSFEKTPIINFGSDVVTERVSLLVTNHFYTVFNFSFLLRGPPLVWITIPSFLNQFVYQALNEMLWLLRVIQLSLTYIYWYAAFQKCTSRISI